MKDWLFAFGIILCSYGLGMLMSGDPNRLIDDMHTKASGYTILASSGILKEYGFYVFLVGLVALTISFFVKRYDRSR